MLRGGQTASIRASSCRLLRVHFAARPSCRAACLGSVRNLILIVLLGVAAAASWWWSRPEPVEAPPPRASGDQELGFYLHGARMLGTDDSGRVAYEMFAD